MFLLKDSKSGMFFKQSRKVTSIKSGKEITESSLTLTDKKSEARIFSKNDSQLAIDSFYESGHGVDFQLYSPKFAIFNKTDGTYLVSLSTCRGDSVKLDFSRSSDRAHTFKNREMLESFMSIAKFASDGDEMDAVVIG